MRSAITYGLLLMGFTLISAPATAHVVVNELENLSAADAALLYLGLGYKHILPLGFDHILFVLGLVIVRPSFRAVMLQSTAFTLAHSLTLGLAMYQVIHLSSKIIEPLIAVSILYVALENIFSPAVKVSRIGLIFLFGLIHGLGFAGALGQMGLPKQAYLSSLIMFNLGVELGQATIIIMACTLLRKLSENRTSFRNKAVIPLSALIALVAGYWTIERIFF